MKKNLFSTAITITILLLIIASSGSFLDTTASAASGASEGQLLVTGLVEHELNLSLTELAAMPKTTVYAAIICVDLPDMIVEEGNWAGVRLSLLLDSAEVSPEAVKVAFYASDGYSTDLTVETAMREDVILAYEKDGVLLDEHLRLVVPGKWGYKWISQVAAIEIVDYDFLGYWEGYGYSDSADIDESSVPEFPATVAMLIPLILVGIFTYIINKKMKTQQTRGSSFPLCSI